MNKTPKTDAKVFMVSVRGAREVVDADFARQLELDCRAWRRDYNALQKTHSRQLRDVAQEIASLKIKLLLAQQFKGKAST